MKILLVTQYFYPENFKSNDIAIELTKRGHEVTVLTGLPNYPTGKIYENYGFFKRKKENYHGVNIIRTWLTPRGKGGIIRLFLNYFSWAFFASIRAFFLAFSSKFDSIIVHEPSPITQGFPAIIVKKIQGIPMYFWVLDLWPETLTSAGGINNKFILSVFTKIVKFIYQNSNKILISSRSFKKSIIAKGDFEERIIYFPNWAEESISKGFADFPVPELPGGFKVLFAGNIGVAQDMVSIGRAALKLKNHKIQFIILGDGRMKESLEQFIKEHDLHKTIHLLGRFPIEAMKTFFDRADALLITLKDEVVFNLTVPAKLQAYMCTKKPILGMLNGEGSKIIQDSDCGFVTNAGNHEEFSKIILKMSELSKDKRDRLGNNGFNYFNKNFTLKTCMNNLEKVLEDSNQ